MNLGDGASVLASKIIWEGGGNWNEKKNKWYLKDENMKWTDMN